MVLAFEPHLVNFKYLLVNLRLNGLSNVLPFNMACYSSEGYLLKSCNQYARTLIY